MSQNFDTIENKKGIIEIFYTKNFQDEDEGPFLREERHLVENISGLITGFLNSVIAREFVGSKKSNDFFEDIENVELKNGTHSRQLLQRFLNKSNYDRDIYHDLMPFKVREILLVANLYDAYSIEKEGRFSEHVLGEYHQLNLTSLPRITGVSTTEEALEQISIKHFDLEILMVGADKQTPVNSSRDHPL